MLQHVPEQTANITFVPLSPLDRTAAQGDGFPGPRETHCQARDLAATVWSTGPSCIPVLSNLEGQLFQGLEHSRYNNDMTGAGSMMIAPAPLVVSPEQ